MTLRPRSVVSRMRLGSRAPAFYFTAVTIGRGIASVDGVQNSVKYHATHKPRPETLRRLRALAPDTDGPSHPYIGATPGCWAIYGEILVREYGEYRYPPVHRLTVDAYAVQHPGVPSRRSIRSVAIHLISLYLQLERGVRLGQATAAIQRAVSCKEGFVWLDHPNR